MYPSTLYPSRRAGLNFDHFLASPFCRAVVWLLIVTFVLFDIPLTLSLADPPPAGTLLYVNATDPNCQGRVRSFPCYTTIQAAVDAAGAGTTVRIQAGEYRETIHFNSKNNVAGASEADRLVIEADPDAQADSVIVGSTSQTCRTGKVIRLKRSRFITLRGLTITGAGSQAIVLKKGNKAIHIERNRLFGNSTNRCQGGIVVGPGNAETLISNNLIYGSGQDGIWFSGNQGGPHYVVQNVIHGNGHNGINVAKGQKVTIVNNLITHNGTDPKPPAQRFGIRRSASQKNGHPETVRLLDNLICGNAHGELSGPLLDGGDAGNLTPTGSEGPGVTAAPHCAELATVFANMNGPDETPNTLDDDFTLAPDSPAIDRGLDPRTVGLPITNTLLEADFFHDRIRPTDGDHDGTAAFDIGAIEQPASPCTSGATKQCYEGPAGTEGIGLCQAGTRTCTSEGTFGPCQGQVLPQPELCNGQDDNCNGQVDESDCAVNTAPTITSTPVTTATAEHLYKYQVTASDPNVGDVLSFSLALAPVGMTIDPNTGLTEWTPATANVGSTTVTVQVSDGHGGVVTQTYTLTVQLNQAPTITSTPVTTATVGQAYSYDVNATDPNAGDALTFSLTTAPAGMTIASSTGLIQWTPTADQVGDQQVTVEVNDGHNGAADQSFTVTVSPVTQNHAPVAQDDAYEARVGFTLHVPAPGVLANDTDADGDPLTATLVQGPTNGELALNADGSFDYTPTAPATTTDTITGNLTQILPTGVTVNVSSFSGLFPPTNLVDGNTNTAWATANGDAASLGKSPFAEIVFPQDVTVTQIHLVSSSSAAVLSTFLAGTFRLFDATGATLFDSGVVNLPAPTHNITLAIPTVSQVRRVRFTGTADQSSQNAIFELEVIGSAVVPNIGLQPQVKWSWTGSPVASNSTQVIVTPIVANLTDDNGDGKIDAKDIPDVLFVSTNRTDNAACGGNGILRAISGKDGSAIFNVTDSTLGVGPCDPVAVGDLDGDHVPEIVAISLTTPARLLILNHDGTLRRAVPLGSDISATVATLTAPSIADLDGDGAPEIVVGATVFDHTGTLLWSHPDTGQSLLSSISTTADLDLDGQLEVVTGFQAYRADGSVFYTTRAAGAPDGGGYPAIGNFDDDPFPEIVVVSDEGSGQSHIYLLAHDGTIKWGPKAIPLGGGGPPTVADFDGDGRPEIGVAGSQRYTVFKADGSILWQNEIRDTSSGITGSSVFDFNADGKAEVVYNDELMLRIYDGATGHLEFETKNPSCTATENPVIVDVDNDGHADIVVARNNICNFGASEGVTDSGIFVFTGGANNWVQARRIWNQHAYHVTNVREDGTIPQHEQANWLIPGLNNFRQNAFAPDDDQADRFTYTASDGQLTSNTATVLITVHPTSNPPVITSTPVTAAAVGVPYTYGVQAHDPDLDDVLTFSLPTAPTGMTINTATGLIQWTPTSSQRGAQSVVVRVQDQTGLFSLQNFTATVGDPVTVPNVVGQPQAAAQTTLTAAGLTVGIVTTAPSDTVPAGNVISQTPAAGSVAATGAAVNLVISSGPQGIIIPNVVGQPQAAAQSAITNAGLTLGTVTTAPSNTVPAGRVISQTPAAGAVVAAGTAVNLVISTGAVSLADLASIVVDPESPIILVGQNQPFTATGVFNDGTSQNLTAIVTWTSSSPSVAAISPMGVATGAADGTTTIKASVSGIMGSSVLTVRAKVAGDSTLPTAAITAPANDQEVTAPVNVIGTATDANFLKYELAYAVAGDTNFTLLATSSSPVTNGVLSSLDPTLLINDLYTLQLTVFDRGGNTATASVTVQVTREQKVGLFTITFQDLSIPLSGIPITINRTYDSRDKGQGDFGIGWRLDVQTMRIRTNRVLGTGWVRGQSGAVITLSPTDAHKVSLTLPDGKVEEFDMQVSPTSGLGGLDFTSVTGFTPRPGTLGKLEALANNSLAILNAGVEDELVDDTTLNTYTPQLFRYTTVDGTQIEIHRTQGVRKVTDLNGNTLTFGPNGILHSAGKSVTFTRDALGRITQITDPNGKSQNYAYNANGDLISHTDQLGNVTRFSYNSTHGLLQIIDPLNRPAIRNEYDATGRLIAQTDAQGNRVTYTHNLNTRQEVITDQLGRTTVVEYDAAGNVVATTDALGHRSTATFDSVGNQLTSTNPLGQTITRTYDNKRNLLTWTDPLGRTTTYTRDANGRPLTITDPRGNTSTMAYDAQGSLIRTTNALGQVTASTYDSAGNMTSLTDPPNTTTQIQYDSAGRRTQLTDPLGTATQMGYDNNGNLLSQHSASGPGWALSYDAKNRIVVTGLGGLQRSFTYDAAGQISKVTIASGEQVPVTFDAVGRLTAIGTPGSGAALQQTYDAVGNTLTVTDAVGNVVNRTYDAANRPISTQRPDGSTEQRSYDAAGRLVQVTDALGHATRFSSDAAGQLTTVTDALGGQTVFQYDANGNKTAVTDPAGRTTQFSYDALNRQTKTTFADGTTESRVYDAAGRIVQFTDAAGNVTTYAYDILGRLLSVTDPLGHITRHDYQGAVQRTATTDANGNTTRFAYDAAGRLIKTTYPMGESETASYDAAGHVLTRTNGKGETIQYQYDTSGRLTGVGLAGGATQSFTYTTDQHLATMTDTRGTTTIDYDPQTRLLVRVTGPDGRYVRYAYDVIGNRTLIAHGDASSELVTQYAYDALNRATQITDANGGVTTQSYDAAGNVTAIARPNGVTSRITYDWRSRISAITDLSPSNTILTGETYSRDTLGNVTNVARNDGSHVEYQYDTLGRVTHERHLDSANTVTFESVDGYDAAGNRITSGPPAAPLTYTYNADNQLVTGGGVTFTYDAAGRRVQEQSASGQSVAYTWDAQDRLASYQGTGGATTTYTYDADGVRQAKDGAGGPDTFLVDRDNVTGFSQIVRESGAGVNRSFVYGSQLLQMGDNGVTQYRHFDALGSTRALTGTTGAVSDTFDYQAYGGVLSHTGTSGIPHRFAGEESDPESGLSYLRARYYDPRTGGFLSRDSELGDPSDPLSLNPYLYAAENPVNRRDPSGHETIPELLVAAYNQVIAQGQRVLNYRHVLGEVSKVTADVTRFVGGLLAFDALVEASRSKARLEKWFGTARFVAFADILAGLGLDGIADIVTGAEYTIDALAFFGLAKTALDMLSGKVGGTDVNIHIQGLGVFTASSISEAVKDLKADTTAGASCAEGRFAYASPPPEGEGPLIGLCTDFFSRPVLPDLAAITIPDKPSMAGVMVHEFTHISIHTNDDAYNCVSYYSGSLGARISGVYTGAGHPGFISSALPLRNADSYECWVEDSAVGTPLP